MPFIFVSNMSDKDFCDLRDDGLGIECQRCGSWKRGKERPSCPPYITRSEPDGDRLPHIKTPEENKRAWIIWNELEVEEHPAPRR